MTTVEQLERIVDELKEVIEKLRSGQVVDRSWLWDKREVIGAANCLSEAFDWGECPYNPDSFREWDDLVEWLENIGEKDD